MYKSFLADSFHREQHQFADVFVLDLVERIMEFKPFDTVHPLFFLDFFGVFDVTRTR